MGDTTRVGASSGVSGTHQSSSSDGIAAPMLKRSGGKATPGSGIKATAQKISTEALEIKLSIKQLKADAGVLRMKKANPTKTQRFCNFCKNIWIGAKNIWYGRNPNTGTIPWRASRFTNTNIGVNPKREMNKTIELKAQGLEAQAKGLETMLKKIDGNAKALDGALGKFSGLDEIIMAKNSGVDKVLNGKPGVGRILQNPDMLKTLQALSQEEFCSENINFIMETLDAFGLGETGQDGSGEVNMTKLTALYEKFVKHDSDDYDRVEINVDYRTRDFTKDAYEAFMANPSDDTAKEFVACMNACVAEINNLMKPIVSKAESADPDIKVLLADLKTKKPAS